MEEFSCKRHFVIFVTEDFKSKNHLQIDTIKCYALTKGPCFCFAMKKVVPHIEICIFGAMLTNVKTNMKSCMFQKEPNLCFKYVVHCSNSKDSKLNM